MTEVFKTNVSSKFKAKLICDLLVTVFPDYQVNFDLSDCDRILRIKSLAAIDVIAVMNLVGECGFEAAVLEDEIKAI